MHRARGSSRAAEDVSSARARIAASAYPRGLDRADRRRRPHPRPGARRPHGHRVFEVHRSGLPNGRHRGDRTAAVSRGRRTRGGAPPPVAQSSGLSGRTRRRGLPDGRPGRRARRRDRAISRWVGATHAVRCRRRERGAHAATRPPPATAGISAGATNVATAGAGARNVGAAGAPPSAPPAGLRQALDLDRDRCHCVRHRDRRAGARQGRCDAAGADRPARKYPPARFPARQAWSGQLPDLSSQLRRRAGHGSLHRMPPQRARRPSRGRRGPIPRFLLRLPSPSRCRAPGARSGVGLQRMPSGRFPAGSPP